MNSLARKIYLLALLVISFLTSVAQSDKFIVEGTVVDRQSKEPVPYATVAIKSTEDDRYLSGITTNEAGGFEIISKSKNVYVEISFIGYEKEVIREISFQNNRADVGVINLSRANQELDEVVVRAEKSTVEFKLDKKVFNVGKDITSTGASATEVLNNVPSVNVDIEGNVSLRGNSGVQILINGKPSVLSDEGSNALGSITADMIESVEVITNPSAKYEAGGTAGIINIVLKKEEKKGLNGSASVNTGIPANHSVGASINYRTDNFNFFTQFGAGYRSLPRYSESVNHNILSGISVETDGVAYRNEEFYNITLGTDYYINKLNVLTLSGNFALELEDQPSNTNFSLYNGSEELISSWERTEETTAINPKYQYDLQYKRQFKDNEDHVLLFSTLGKFFGKELSSEFENSAISGSEVVGNQQTETNFYQADYTFKLDYTKPFSDKLTYEGGSQYEINDVGNDYAVYNLENGDWVQDPGFSNNFQYDQKVLGVYSTGAYEGDQWGLKLGLRVENTDLHTLLTTTNEENNQNYTNFFPTIHSSYKINPMFSVQAGYSRRIYRPRLWDLNPFFNIRNNYNIRTGNPNLQPEFADSYELTGVINFEKFFINASVYYLYTTDLIARVSTAVDNVTFTTPMNIGVRGKTGLELNGKFNLAKWMSLQGDFNYGFFRREGVFEGQDFGFQGDQWSTKLTTKLKLPAEFDVEITSNYQSKYKTVQGTTSGFLFMNAGVRKKLWKGKTIVNFNVRDVFASRIRETFVTQGDYFLYNFSKRGRFFTLGLSYSFGKGEAMTYSGRRHH